LDHICNLIILSKHKKTTSVDPVPFCRSQRKIWNSYIIYLDRQCPLHLVTPFFFPNSVWCNQVSSSNSPLPSTTTMQPTTSPSMHCIQWHSDNNCLLQVLQCQQYETSLLLFLLVSEIIHSWRKFSRQQVDMWLT